MIHSSAEVGLPGKTGVVSSWAWPGTGIAPGERVEQDVQGLDKDLPASSSAGSSAVIITHLIS